MSVSGPICALDIDGVLENETLDAPSLTPSSALALRALLLHGYRIVLATGRSLDEVRERCQAYRLIGGVAEYGAVIYNHSTGKVSSQLGEAEIADLERLRSVLLTDNTMHVDPDFRYSVRAYRIDRTGRRRGLADEATASALDRSGMQGRMCAIRGDGQPDFVNAGIDKGTGLRAFMAQSEFQNVQVQGRPLAFAVGDTKSDLPMFELAVHAFAPANADASVKDAAANREHIRVMKRPHQRGLAQAIALMLRHPPAGCPVCKAPAHSAETRLLLTLLGVPEHSKWGVIAQALVLSLTARSH
jgi:hydroxymethylpyrimidine pyrophosphatase-like HAD family hydrolase